MIYEYTESNSIVFLTFITGMEVTESVLPKVALKTIQIYTFIVTTLQTKKGIIQQL